MEGGLDSRTSSVADILADIQVVRHADKQIGRAANGQMGVGPTTPLARGRRVPEWNLGGLGD